MTESITCDRCGTAVPADEWRHNAHATAEFGWVEKSMTGKYERGPIEAHLCGDCTDWLADEFGGAVPGGWDRWTGDDDPEAR